MVPWLLVSLIALYNRTQNVSQLDGPKDIQQ